MVGVQLTLSLSYVLGTSLAGAVLTYLAKLPMLGDACGVRLAYLTSLLEVVIVIVFISMLGYKDFKGARYSNARVLLLIFGI